MPRISDRHAEVRPDGKLHYRARLESGSGRSSINLDFCCNTDGASRISALEAEVLEKLDYRDAIIDPINALIGRRNVRGLWYTILDANIQNVAAGAWRLYLLWEAEIPGNPVQKVQQDWQQMVSHPVEIIPLDKIVKTIEDGVKQLANNRDRAKRASDDILNGGSR